MIYKTINLVQLCRLCAKGDQEALAEWKRRWEADYPEVGVCDEIQTSQERVGSYPFQSKNGESVSLKGNNGSH